MFQKTVLLTPVFCGELDRPTTQQELPDHTRQILPLGVTHPKMPQTRAERAACGTQKYAILASAEFKTSKGVYSLNYNWNKVAHVLGFTVLLMRTHRHLHLFREQKRDVNDLI